ncbi:hypothetical protein EON82_08735 [bacterium]|nr:MAG: hypothetical protein EON82_08735 [bacterium]
MSRIEMHIAKPCNQSWTAMKGDERVRFCGSCQKNVYNLTEMSEAEIEELIRQTDGKFCGRLYRRTDNRVMAQDCPKGVAAVRRRIGFGLAAAIGAAYTLSSPAFVMGGASSKPIARPAVGEESEERTIGKVAIMPDVRMGAIAIIPKRPTTMKTGGVE